jgi:flagellar FliL protein
VSAESIDAVPAEAGAPPRKRGKLLIGIAVLLLAAGGAGAWYFLQPAPTDAAVENAPSAAPPLYFVLDPGLVVNFEGGGRVRYLQLGIELQTRDPRALEALKLHAPVVRNNLILLLSGQSYEQLLTREGKEALRAAALAEVQAVLQERYGSPAVDTLYFTNFVMQ